MNRIYILLFFILLSGCAPKTYDYYFTEKRYRFDYEINGDHTHQEIKELALYEEKIWGGSKVNLIDTFEYGAYLLKIIDEKSNQVIYSRGFSDLFLEWQTTAEAKETFKSYRQTLLFPAPKRKIRLEIVKRDTSMQWELMYTKHIQPNSAPTSKRAPGEIESRIIHYGDKPDKALDIVLLAEGYTREEVNKFFTDAEKFKAFLFEWFPYKNYTQRINFNAVFSPSKDSGVDVPGENIFVESIVDAHFYTFGIERYLTLPDLTKVYNFLSEYPVDQVVVLVNSEIYGGGGIYNFYNIFTSDSKHGERLFLHEFGHGFGGLGDEYYTSEVAYESFGNKNYEPYEPNITNLVNFNKKWKSMLADSIPIPTPDTDEYEGVLGVFEGANYVPKEFYRPYRTCAMKEIHIKYFCPVCEKSLEEMMKFYAE